MKVADGVDLGQHECSDERRLELEDRQDPGGEYRLWKWGTPTISDISFSKKGVVISFRRTAIRSGCGSLCSGVRYPVSKVSGSRVKIRRTRMCLRTLRNVLSRCLALSLS